MNKSVWGNDEVLFSGEGVQEEDKEKIKYDKDSDDDDDGDGSGEEDNKEEEEEGEEELMGSSKLSLCERIKDKVLYLYSLMFFNLVFFVFLMRILQQCFWINIFIY